MYSNDRLIILDADGTTVDAFSAIDKTFALHGMNIGPLSGFQKRRHVFKYLGGVKEFPRNLRKQFARQKRSRLIATMTEVYREEGHLYDGIAQLLERLTGEPGLRVGIVTRNITRDPVATLETLFRREGVDPSRFHFLVHLPLALDKLDAFRAVRAQFEVNPALSFACGDEATDYQAAVGAGIHPFIVSYGFEDFERLAVRHGIPEEVISRSPADLSARLLNALGLETDAANFTTSS
ncbi:HAD hydrolase-like protein [uncultured Thiodictyon sp.]|uniref:HAD family hydrolase n=1 Tax=uncultured Thiodictyon sp. TaxID=1846217 RepID=UPI0025F3F865|nr:HAD hydrolase-like protein [uncultured Thiodictyon sp.]